MEAPWGRHTRSALGPPWRHHSGAVETPMVFRVHHEGTMRAQWSIETTMAVTTAGATSTLRETVPTETQTGLPTPSGATTPAATDNPEAVRHSNPPPPPQGPPSPALTWSVPQPSPPRLRYRQTYATDPHKTAATTTCANRAFFAGTDRPMLNIRSRLHQKHRTCISFPELLTPLTRPTIFHSSNPLLTNLQH